MKNVPKKILFACSHYSDYFNDFFSLFFSSFSFISSQPSLSSHFLLHLHSEFLSFPPLPICISQSTINPARLLSSDPALPPTQLANFCSPFHRPSSPIFLHSSPAQLPYPNVFLHSLLTLTLANPSRGFRRVQCGFQV